MMSKVEREIETTWGKIEIGLLNGWVVRCTLSCIRVHQNIYISGQICSEINLFYTRFLNMYSSLHFAYIPPIERATGT
jgi:hypothetical protein